MKYLTFSILVIAALGYLLWEQGALEGSPAGKVATKAVAAIEEKTKPYLERVLPDEVEGHERSERKQAQGNARHREDLSEELQWPKPAVEPIPASQPHEPRRGDEETAGETIQEPPRTEERDLAEDAVVASGSLPVQMAAALIVPETVSPEVAARRAEVLGRQGTAAPVPGKPDRELGKRKERLHALAEEAELLSVELLYQ